MGIKNLKKWLRTKHEDVIRKIHITEYHNEKIAVDISSYIYKYKVVFGDSWLNCFPNLLCSLKKNGIHAVFVFDGKPPPEKDREKEKRRSDRKNIEDNITNIDTELELYKAGERDPVMLKTLVSVMEKISINDKNWEKQNRLLYSGKKPEEIVTTASINVDKITDYILKKQRQIVNITRGDIENLKTLLTLFGVPHIQAEGEAEALCCMLCINGDVCAVLSEDTDVLCYGCGVFLSDYNIASGVCEIIKLSDVLESTELTMDSFRDYCIMCGTDYNDNISGYGNEKVYKLISTHKSIEEIKKTLGEKTDILNYVRVREIFSSFGGMNKNPPATPTYWDTNVDFARLYDFLDSVNVKYSSENIEELWKGADIVFE
jgi:5'-3' exonuclease